jgi:SAM-dependent methyltransferase
MNKCIACGSGEVEEFLDLGSTVLANKFLAESELGQAEPRYPLAVGFCHKCSHVQLMNIVPPAKMFTDYLYISSASDTLKNHLLELGELVCQRYQLGSSDLVIDIGCNDGTLLSGFQQHGVRVLGVDPAENLAELNKDSGIERFPHFFNLENARKIVNQWGTASAITATNTFPHIPDLPDFIAGLDHALAPGGVLVLEMHYLADLVEQRAFDTIYHEHVSYWALQPMASLFQRFGMEITHVEHLPLHHGQMRVFVQRVGEGPVQPSIAALLEQEKATRLGEIETYREFARNTMQVKENLTDTLRSFKNQGYKIVGYGAPAKSTTLLEFLGLGRETIEYIVDRSSLKQGRFTPGTHVPIVPTERLLEDQPDYVLLLAWNFFDEIMEQQKEYRARQGKFILPIPEVKIV